MPIRTAPHDAKLLDFAAHADLEECAEPYAPPYAEDYNRLPVLRLVTSAGFLSSRPWASIPLTSTGSCWTLR